MARHKKGETTRAMSSSALVSADWTPLGSDAHYRKVELYQMLWGDDVRIDKHIVVGAPFGGPLALVKDLRKATAKEQAAAASGSAAARVRVFTSSGKAISEFSLEKETLRNLVTMGWSDSEQLVLVMSDGQVHTYTLHGERVSTFSLGAECKSEGVAEAHLWGNGLVARTPGGGVASQLFAITDLTKPRVTRLASPASAAPVRNAGAAAGAGAGATSSGVSQGPPTAMCVIPPRFTAHGGVEVLVATDRGSIVVCDEKSAMDLDVDCGPFIKLQVSPSGQQVACFSDKGTLHIFTTDFAKHLCKFATKSKIPPAAMGWCGSDAVVMYWDQIMLMVGKDSNFVKYSYDSGVGMHLVTECDGVRIVTSSTCEFLSPVAESTQRVFKIGSTRPAALLFDATEAYDAKSVKADENIRQIKENKQLVQAVEDCLDAAAHEVSFNVQRSLLKAAAYGKLCAGDQYKADAFVDMCRTLRVLNAVRHYDIGLAITYEQYGKLEGDVLVDRLINRHHHLLAMRICKYLRMAPERVLVHWACAKIKASDEEDEKSLGAKIVDKLSACPGISFSHIATTAFHSGRRALATMLLEYEPRATDQVPLLISMKEDELALKKAIDSGDTDLVYLAILHIHKTKPFKDFFALIKDKPLACNLYVAYCKQKDLPNLKNFYYFLQKATDAANIAVLEAYQSDTWKDRMQGLNIATELFNRDAKAGRDPTSYQLTEEHMQLLKLQAKWELEAPATGMGSGAQYVDLSVSDMLTAAIREGASARAMLLKKQFAIPDKRFWHLQVRTLAKAKAWDELGKLVAALKGKAPPIGYLPFVEACVEQKNYVDAAKYIKLLSDPHEAMEWLCNIGYWKEAAEIAAKEKDADALQLIRARCRNDAVIRYVDGVLQALSSS